MGSSIKINSISIDLAGAADEIGVGKCEHFSIRGFVSEVRQRDWKKCWPFSVDSALEDQSYSLPSLSVPKFRWWDCGSCVRDINAEGISNASDAMLLSDCQLHSNSRALSERKLETEAVAIPSKSNCHSPTGAEKHERKADVAGNSIGSDENENVNHERCQKDDQTVALRKKARRRSMDASTVGSKSKKLASSEHASRKSKERVNGSMEISRKENREAINGQIAEAMTTFGSSEIAGVVDDTPKAIKNHKSGNVSVELDECDNVSSESAILARNLLDHNPDNITSLHRRKTRKVRLLSELLGKANTKTNSAVRNEESPSRRESVRGRKRKSSGDEEWRPPETTPGNNYVNRKLSTIGKNSENASQSSDSEDNALSGVGSQPSVESQSTDNGSDRDPIKGKKKNQRFQVVDEHLPAVSLENSLKGILENDEGLPKRKPGESTFASSVQASFAGKESVRCPLHNQKTEKKSSLPKKKNKKPLIDNKKDPMITFSYGVPEGNQIKVRKSEVLQTSSMNAIAQSARDVSNGKGLGPSFDRLLASERCVRKYIPQLEDRPMFSLPWQEINPKDGHVMPRDTETNHFRDFASSSKSNVDGCLRTGVYVDLSSSGNTDILPYLNEKLRHNISADVAEYSFMLQKDTSAAHSKGKTVVVQENSGASRIQNDHNKEKTPEHLDDITMEIVELMAKNQYLRCLPDREEEDNNNNNKQPSQATISTSKNALLIDLNKTYENGVSQEENITSQQPKPRGKNARKGDTTKGEHFLTAKENSLDFFPISQFGQPYMPSGFGIFPLTRDNTSNSIQFSGGQSSHNCQWLQNVETMANKNPSPSSFRVLRACNTCQSVPQQYREASHSIWPSSVIPQNQMPVSFNTPQKFMDQSTKLDMLSHASNDDLNSWNLNFLNPGKQKRGFDSEYSFGCKHGGVSSRSLDPYSNESSIPAMHLLSLMDARLRSNTFVDLPGNPKFTKRPSFSQVHQSKDFPGLQPGEYNKAANSTKQLPFDFYSKRLSPEASRENFAAIPAVATSSFLFQNDKSFAKVPDLTGQASWKHQEKKAKRKNAVSPINNSQKSIFTSSNPGKFQLLGASDSMMLPLKFHTKDNAIKQKAKEQSYKATAWPRKSSSGPILCSINRNPADFTVPEPGNVYMIKGEDLKVRKRASVRKKPSLCKQSVLKQNKKPVAPATENA